MADPRAGVSNGDIVGDVDKPAFVGPVGLAGWLILPLLGLVVTPLLTIWAQWDGIGQLTTAWAYTSSGQKAFIVLEYGLIAILFLVTPVVALFLAFRRSEMFPGLYIVWICALPLFVLIDGLLTLWLFGDHLASEQVFDPQTKRSITQGIGQAVLWTWYMNSSRRVANTFIN